MYDLIVIGDDLSSHIAAAVASRYGLSTVLIAESGVGGTCFIGNYAFNIDPTPLTGFGINQTALSLLAELNIPFTELEAFLLNPAYQIIMTEHRIDFFSDKNSLVKEMTREFPELTEEITNFYNTVIKNSAIFSKWLHENPFVKIKNIRGYYRYLKLIPYLIKYKFDAIKFNRILLRNVSLRKILEAQKVLLSYTTGDQDFFSTHFLYSAPLRGVYYFQKGKQVFFNSLINKIESKNGLYLNNCKVLEIKKGRFKEVKIANRDGLISNISTKNLIVSTKWQGMHLLLEGKKNINISDWIRPIKVFYYPFTIHLGINQKCIPEKMARYVAVISDVNKSIYDNNLIILESSMSEEENTATKTKISLTATIFLHIDPQIWSKENLKKNALSIIERLEYFLPFLKENIELFDIEKSIDISMKRHQVVNPKYQLRKYFISDFAAKSNKTRFKNIYLTGASLLTDAGFEGEIISGRNAAATVISKRK